MAGQDPDFERLPECVGEYVRAVVKKMGYRRRVRGEVARELADHFADALGDCTSDEERQERARRLITEFGDAKLLAVLIRRGKKRCRPAWKKAIIRSFQACGVLLVLMILYTGWFLTGKPAPTIDYVAVLNEKSRPMVVEENNAWPYYQRALDLYAPPSGDTEDLLKRTTGPQSRTTGLAGLTDAERQDLTAWLSENRHASDQYVAGSQKPYYWMEYATGSREEQWVFSILLPHLRGLRYLSRAGIWRARIAYTEGRVQDSVADCLAVARTARHFQRPATTLIEQLVGWAIGALADRELLYMAASGVLSGVDLKDAQIELEVVYGAEWPPMDLVFERLTFADVVQRCFTQGGLGGGHLMPRQLAFVFGVTRGDRGDLDWEELAKYTAGSMIHHRRNETLAKANEVYGRLGVLVNMTPYQKHLRQICEDDLADGLAEYRHFRHFLFRAFLPSFGRLSHVYHQRKATHQATITVLALRRWFLEKGGYPDGLDELVNAGYIKVAPDDPYSDGPLKYEPRGDDFVLYSLGGDFDDDGGVETDGNPWGEKEEGGDRVFWPVE